MWRPSSPLLALPSLRFCPVADAFGAPVLRGQGPIGRPGKADPSRDPLHAIYGTEAHVAADMAVKLWLLLPAEYRG
jgi:hypothetical protein